MKKELLFFFALMVYFAKARQNFLLAHTDKGFVRGAHQYTLNGRRFLAFTGIPYAKPPVKLLRFKVAVEAEPWKGVLAATKKPAICPQMNLLLNDTNIKGEEDCLYLNVYKPEQRNFNKSKLLPVLVFIYGGGFTTGSGNSDWYGPGILLDKDVVLVTFNYRIGALGFLSTGDEIVPGNNGLKDQNLVLRWVKREIINFGGDPSKITIFGQSAGAASVHYHVVSPSSKGLFNNAIAHSGSAIGVWSISPGNQTIRNSKRLGKLLNCPVMSNEEMIDCLRKADAYDIIAQERVFMKYLYSPAVPFKPIVEPNVENAFLTKHPVEMIKSGYTSGATLIFGITTDDGAYRAAGFYNNSQVIERINRNMYDILPVALQYQETTTKENQDYITSNIRKFYFGNKDLNNSTKSGLTNLYTDLWFFYPQNQVARLHAKYTNATVYYFVFGYKGSITLGPIYGDPTHDYGVCHGDDINYLLTKDTFDPYIPTKLDRKTIGLQTAMWLNVAETGNPTPKLSSIIKTKWVPIQNDKGLLYYFIGNESSGNMVENIYSERNDFWERMPLYSTENDTYLNVPAKQVASHLQLTSTIIIFLIKLIELLF